MYNKHISTKCFFGGVLTLGIAAIVGVTSYQNNRVESCIKAGAAAVLSRGMLPPMPFNNTNECIDLAKELNRKSNIAAYCRLSKSILTHG